MEHSQNYDYFARNGDPVACVVVRPPHLFSDVGVVLAKPRHELRVVRVLEHAQHVVVHEHLWFSAG